MKLAASGVETLMGSIWKPELTMGNVLYDGLIEKDQNSLDFEDIYTASFRVQSSMVHTRGFGLTRSYSAAAWWGGSVRGCAKNPNLAEAIADCL